MATLVIKQWVTNNEPIDQEGNYIVISGRESGLFAWFLALVGVDPTTKIKVSFKRIEFQSSSLSGTNSRMIPLQGVCSTYYGYHKPWKKALGIFVVLMVLFISLGSVLAQANATGSSYGLFLFGTLVSIVIALIYYFLNRTLTFGFIEISGVISGIMFKRSVIENVDVNEQQARAVCELTQSVIEKVQNRECRFCGQDIAQPQSSPQPKPHQMQVYPKKIVMQPKPPVTPSPPPEGKVACPLCNATIFLSTIRVGRNICPSCKGAFDAEA